MSPENFVADLQSAVFFCKGIILGIFRNFSLLSPEMLLSKEKSQGISAVRCIKGLLTSQNPNDQYLFLTCLECLDPMVWAGTSEEYLAILDASEVGRVMEFLDAPDHLMRKKVGPKLYPTSASLRPLVDHGNIKPHRPQHFVSILYPSVTIYTYGVNHHGAKRLCRSSA